MPKSYEELSNALISDMLSEDEDILEELLAYDLHSTLESSKSKFCVA